MNRNAAIVAIVDCLLREGTVAPAGPPEDGKPYFRPSAAPPLPTAKGVGRNDPCPCGSGHKWKVCGLRRKCELGGPTE